MYIYISLSLFVAENIVFIILSPNMQHIVYGDIHVCTHHMCLLIILLVRVNILANVINCESNVVYQCSVPLLVPYLWLKMKSLSKTKSWVSYYSYHITLLQILGKSLFMRGGGTRTVMMYRYVPPYGVHFDAQLLVTGWGAFSCLLVTSLQIL